MIKNRDTLKMSAMFSYHRGTRKQYANVFGVKVNKKFGEMFYCRTYKWKKKKVENLREIFTINPVADLKETELYKTLNDNERKVFKKWIPIISLMFDKKKKVMPL